MAGNSRRYQLALGNRHRGAACVVALALAAMLLLTLRPWQGSDAAAPSQGTENNHAPRVADDWRGALDQGVGQEWEYRRDVDVPDAARELVVRYRDEGTCLVRSAGYLDLVGNVWGCVMEGPGWVDLCVVRRSDGGSVVRCVRMEAGEWEEGYGGSSAVRTGPVER